MLILINQEPFVLADDATLADAVAAYPHQGPIAAALNLQFVARTLYRQTPLRPNDRVEIIAPVTGG